MQKIIGVTDLQRNFRAVFDDVTGNHDEYVLTRGSCPEAVLLSYAEFIRLKALDETAALSRHDRLLERMAEHNERFSEDEVAADVEAARHERHA